MAEERQSGLGGAGRNRIRENLGKGTSDQGRYEQGMFGGLAPLPQRPATDWTYPLSSRVEAYSYDFDQQQLRVKFIKYGTPWVYDNVPMAIFDAFNSAPSKGMYINSTLNHMTHRRASAQEVATYFGSV
jgi:hypothetical protein